MTEPYTNCISLINFLKVYTVQSVPRAAAEIFDRSRTAAAVVPQLAAEPQPQVFYEKFHFQNMLKKIIPDVREFLKKQVASFISHTL